MPRDAQWIQGEAEEIAKLIANYRQIETRVRWLQQAIDAGDSEFVGEMLYWDPDLILARIDIEGIGKTTVLGYAAWRGDKEICKHLLSEGAALEEGRDPELLLAFHLAKRQQHLEVISLLKHLDHEEVQP